MIRITKRPKQVMVEHEEVVGYISQYYCPACHITYRGGGPERNVVRFMCKCGQELIVKVVKP